MKKEEFDSLLAEIDTETTRMGVKFEELFAKLREGGLTPEEEAAVHAEGSRLVAKMKGLGHDPANPVPNPEPEPTPGDGGTETTRS